MQQGLEMLSKLRLIIGLSLCVLLGLYLAVALWGGYGNVQISAMIGGKGTSLGRSLHSVYIIVLAASAVLYTCSGWSKRWISRSVVTVTLTTLLALTIFPVAIAVYRNAPPSLYENYIGEAITAAICIAALLCEFFTKSAYQVDAPKAATGALPALRRLLRRPGAR